MSKSLKLMRRSLATSAQIWYSSKYSFKYWLWAHSDSCRLNTLYRLRVTAVLSSSCRATVKSLSSVHSSTTVAELPAECQLHVPCRQNSTLTHTLRALANDKSHFGTCDMAANNAEESLNFESSSSFPFFKRRVLQAWSAKSVAWEISERFGSNTTVLYMGGKVDIHTCESLLSSRLEEATGKAGNGKQEQESECAKGRDQTTPRSC